MITLSLLLAAATTSAADSLKNFNIEEAVVVASPKETSQLRRQGVSASLFDGQDLERRQVGSLKGLSSLTPNFYMPAYGSRITSAVYVRGIGSRMGTPAVGLYVDNVPYGDKSAYDFAFNGVERVDILRGPQGTLYGSNTMGGLVRVFTADPLTHSGTELRAGFTTRTAARRASFTTFLHPAEGMGLSLTGYYNGENGFFRNHTTGKKQDGSEAGGGRLRWAWRATERVKIDLTASYEYSDEDACPYFFEENLAEGGMTDGMGTISQNRPSGYRRSLFNAGLGVEHRLDRLTLTSTTAFQRLTDRLFMDQDFTSADLFSLEQRQYLSSLSEEIALRTNRPGARWQWTTGLFASWQHLRTNCPVTFYGEGVSYLNSQMAAALPDGMGMSLGFTDSELPFTSRLVTPSASAALFHQSNVRLFSHLTLTLGLRVGYDYRELRLTSGTPAPVGYNFNMAMLQRYFPQGKDLEADPAVSGNLYHHTWQVLPKGALSYELPRGLGNIYFSVSKGSRAGGYNVQSYSDLCQTALRRAVMLGVRDFSVTTINQMPLPEASKEKALAGMTAALDQYTPDAPAVSSLYYKPEYTWSYELGLHHNLVGEMLQLDLCGFFMKTRDQQLARFAGSGLGREMVNAGRSRSRGLEVSLRSLLLRERLNLSASYGFTHAVFTAYDLGTSSSTGAATDYTGNRVPYAPRHTLSLSADFRQPLRECFVEALSLGGDLRGAGDVYWDEANTFSQPFYATLGLRLGAELRGGVRIELFARNLTATRYATFAFDSMSRRFAQYGQPRHFGLDVSWKF